MKNKYKNKYSRVADLYDIFVDLESDIPFWVNESKKDGEVLELASGTGRVTIPIAMAGVKVTAVDISSDLLAILREKTRRNRLGVEIHEADMRSFRLDRRFPLVILPFNSIQEIVGPKDHKAVFLRVKEHLEDGGRFIVTIRNPNPHRRDGSNEKQVIEYTNQTNGHRVLYSSRTKTDTRKHVEVSYQTYKEYDEDSKFIGRRLFRNRYYVFQEGEFERLIESVGFRVKNLYGNYPYVKFTEDSPLRIYELVVDQGQ
jgi:SAM-dependent methyltransferase